MFRVRSSQSAMRSMCGLAPAGFSKSADHVSNKFANLTSSETSMLRQFPKRSFSIAQAPKVQEVAPRPWILEGPKIARPQI